MIAVIQCAARKQARAGRLQLSTGKPVVFVADPKAAPADDAVVYARPDDLADDGTSWRDVLKKYNAEQRDNPLGLFQAYRLYEDRTYGRLVDHFGLQNVYILSAGWGLIGLYKTEVIRRRGPWRTLEAVEFATLEWVDWFNMRRLLGPIGDVPPAECEAQYYEQAKVA